jgi:hypothetical protein
MAIDFMRASFAWDVLRVYGKARARQHRHFLLRCGHFYPEAAATVCVNFRPPPLTIKGMTPHV